LPDRRGDALIQEIRALHSTLPIILCTGENLASLRAAFQGQKNFEFVAKPYTDGDLVAALRSLGLGRSHRLTKD
jgi:CheY-like chemotaxis protein